MTTEPSYQNDPLHELCLIDRLAQHPELMEEGPWAKALAKVRAMTPVPFITASDVPFYEWLMVSNNMTITQWQAAQRLQDHGMSWEEAVAQATGQ